MKLTNTQFRAISELIGHFNKSYTENYSQIIEFKAPTGSGKTFMIANFIDKAISFNKQRDNKPIIFIVMTLSNAELPKQMEDNFNEYKFYLENKQDIIFERKESPSSSKNSVKDADYTFKIESNKVFILGASSFGKGKIYTEQGILEKFISEISNNYFVVFIRDEAHIGTNESGLKSEEKKQAENFYNKMKNAANFQINMTATPKGSYKQVKITENQLKEDDIKLIKTTSYLNEGLSEIKNEQISDLDLLEIACNRFNKIKQKYITEEGLIDNINPAMLIQVKDKTKNDLEFDEKIEKIIHKLEQHNLTWAKYFSSEKLDANMRGNFSLKDISKNSSDIDVIIFKVGPATGWNIPRACMLVQLRNVSSESLSIQTIGRIKRNPNPSFNFNHDSYAFKYWVYSNIKDIENLYKDKEFSVYKLNKDSIDDKFYYGEINKEVNQIEITNSDSIFNCLKQNKNKLINEYQYYCQYYNQYGFLPYKDQTIVDQKTNIQYQYINKKINNIVELSQYIKEFELKVANILTKKQINDINDYFNREYKDNINLLMWYTFINSIYVDVKKYILEERKKKINKLDINEFKLIYDKKLPEDVNFEITDEKNKIEFSEQNLKYKYELTGIKSNQNNHPHYYDSENEVSFINGIIHLFNDDLKKDEYMDVNLFRNPVGNGIFYEYYDDENNIKRQFPDFILVYKTKKIEHQISIEIKDFHSDNNINKTSKIIDSYKGYYSEMKKNQTPLQIVSSILIKVDKTNNYLNKFIVSGGGSTNLKSHNEIKNSIKNKKDITWIYNLAKNI
ncbi:DEAD/DEAH box helicase family protein [Mycoplasma miroungirhinis]|uniref:DEAD/DEAH box helicase family protein n=1 Tax=Mycoplasma miroungirhinis TaxID=754516 RepID=A0A6M4JCW3_9MOLU|nr:DEAD/DEAH box helicase family protein [Mycoplasma miroungirhinis]QJR43917.1 DEAD/DEAH box helicase family protein [Mycoplasma miroungirhinis]